MGDCLIGGKNEDSMVFASRDNTSIEGRDPHIKEEN